MKKLFVTSDIHSFHSALLKALSDKGFDEGDPDHVLVVLGDAFDRGPETLGVLGFLRSMPKDRRVYVRGNHEILFHELRKRGFEKGYDVSNGTLNTLYAVAGLGGLEQVDAEFRRRCAENRGKDGWDVFAAWDERREAISRAYDHPDAVALDEWVMSDDWLDYWETDDYVFVHSFIPLSMRMVGGFGYEYAEPVGYREDWRNATKWEWEDATWPCPWRLAKEGYNKTGKTIVCGHWHTSDFFNNLGNSKRKKDIGDNPIFKSRKYGIIGLDACTALTGKVNVLTIELEDDEWERWRPGRTKR